uniref:CDAN1-interacting nuclease 1 n=1 Tax=Tetranychus urticae TaxID=32264 RepID=T1K140_TETUR
MYVHQSDTRAKVGKVDWAKAYDDYKNGKGTILEIAKELDISPTIVAKRFLLNISDKLTVKQWLQDTNEIPNGELAVQVMMAQYADPIFGQLSHCVMRNAGELFEYEVAQILKKAQISYASENSLRTKEFDVTPDFKLNIPIEILSLFASGHCHKDYLKYQFNSYANRFGRGLILYKYGCTRSVMKRDPKLIIAEELVYHECANQLANLRL